MEIRIKTDSRKVTKGDIFVALRGVSSDGHDYINQAIQNGASKLIVEEDKNYEIEYEVVNDTRKYLINYLSENYGKYIDELKIIGFTGTNGKTTSAFMLHTALNMINIKCSYIGTIGFYINKKIENLNNTTPDVLEIFNLLLKSYEMGCKYVCMEVSSQGLSYKRVEGFKFDYAIFTNLTQDHLDYHKTMENYMNAKIELFKKLKPNGVALINFDDKYKDNFLLQNNINYTYGFDGGDFKISECKSNNLKTEFTYIYLNNENKIETKLIGKYNIYNLLTVISILNLIGINQEKIKNICLNLCAAPGRIQTIHYKNNSIVIDYAHTPDAVEKIINTMKKITKGNIYTVFGCTGDRDRTKRPIMMQLATTLSTKVIITNDDPHYEDPKQIVEDMLKENQNSNYEIILDRKKAIEKGINLLNQFDTLLILGKGHEEYMIIKDKKVPFNDSQVVNEIIKAKELVK